MKLKCQRNKRTGEWWILNPNHVENESMRMFGPYETREKADTDRIGMNKLNTHHKKKHYITTD
jgi:hypothetical protein